MSDKYFWCIGGGSLQMPVVKKAKELDMKIIVTDMNDKCDCKELADIFSPIDIFDYKSHLGLALGFQKAGIEIQGVLAAGIDANVTHSYLDHFLGHNRTAPIEAAITCHDKLKFRHFQRYMHYPYPSFRPITNSSDVVAFMHDTGHENVYVKETSNSAGRGMRKLEKYSRFQKKMFNKDKTYIVEEALYGTEHTVETLMSDGRFYPCFITDRYFAHKAKDWKAPSIEIGLRNPTTLPEWKQMVMFGTAYKLCKDLGIKNGAMKLDVIDTPDGPVVLEATTRLSGGFDCQYLVPAATGMDVVKAAILNAIGRGVLNEAIMMALTKTKDKVAITESLWPPCGKKIVKIDDSIALKLAGVELIYWRYKEGEVVEDYVDSSKRVCFIMTSGKTEDEARAIMFSAIENIVLEVE